MPTVILILGWRLYFFSNEGKEPIHIHAEKGDKECKFWLNEEEFEIKEEYSYNMSPADRKEIRKIIFQHFELIVNEWNNFFKK